MRQLTLPGIAEDPASTLARERAALAKRAELDAQMRKAKAEALALHAFAKGGASPVVSIETRRARLLG